jgi:hypothetical protein
MVPANRGGEVTHVSSGLMILDVFMAVRIPCRNHEQNTRKKLSFRGNLKIDVLTLFSLSEMLL